MARVLSCLILFYLFVLQFSNIADAGSVGVNYGVIADNLPPPTEVINLIKSRQITKVRIFQPYPDILQALAGTGIEVIVGTLNQDLQPLSSDLSFAKTWVQNNVVPYAASVQFRCISAGNEVIPGPLAGFVVQAILNLRQALNEANLENIPVSTTVATTVLGNSFPPSAGEFLSDITSIMAPISTILTFTHSPLLLNVYPYFAYTGNKKDISLPYALLSSDQVVVQDGSLGYKYLFDAMVDAVYSALEKMEGERIKIVVSETGWPSKEDADVATVENAAAYNGNLVKHVSSLDGTPKRPGMSIETYLFALFNEDQKPPGTEQNFGLYYPDKTEVYHVDFPV